MAQKSPSPAKTQSSDLAFVARRLGLCFLLGALGLSLYLAYTSLTNGTVAGCAEEAVATRSSPASGATSSESP